MELLVVMFDQKQTLSNISSKKKCWTNIFQHGRPNGLTMLDRAKLEPSIQLCSIAWPGLNESLFKGTSHKQTSESIFMISERMYPTYSVTRDYTIYQFLVIQKDNWKSRVARAGPTIFVTLVGFSTHWDTRNLWAWPCNANSSVLMQLTTNETVNLVRKVMKSWRSL